MKKLIALLVLAPWFFLHAAPLEIQYFDQSPDFFPEARMFSATYQDLELRGIEYGPKDGQPLILVGGYSSNLPYLRKMVRELGSRGFRVFNYNPPGQGRHELKSVAEDRTWEGLEGLLQALDLMHETVYGMTNKKIVLAGHSLGGVQVRLFTLGLQGHRTQGLKVSRSRQQKIQQQTALVVPLFSPALNLEEKSNQGLDFMDELRLKASTTLLLDIVPRGVEFTHFCGKFIPDRLQTLIDFTSACYLALADKLNPALKPLFGSPNLDFRELFEVGFQSASESVSPVIAEDLTHWLKVRNVETRRGFDFANKWFQKQSSKHAVPSLYFIANSDMLAHPKDVLPEVQSLEAKHLIVPGGHIGPFFDKDLVGVMVDRILEELSLLESCESFFVRAG